MISGRVLLKVAFSMKRFFFLLLILASLTLSAQTNHLIDSLESLLRTKQLTTEEKVHVLTDLSWEYDAFDPSKAKQLALEAVALSESNHLDKEKDKAREALASALNSGGDFDEAEKLYKELVLYYRQKNDNVSLTKMYNNLAMLYNDKGAFDEAGKNLVLALNYAEKQTDTLLIVATYINLSNNYSLRNKRDECMATLLKAKPFADAFHEKKLKGQFYSSLGSACLHSSDKSKAFAYFREAEKIYQENKSDYNLARLYVNMGNGALAIDDNPLARTYLRKAISLFGAAYDPTALTAALANIGASYFNEALMMPENRRRVKVDSSLFYMDSALAVANRFKLMRHQIELNRKEADIYYLSGRFKDAFIALNDYNLVRDSVMTLEKEREVQKLNTIYEVSKKDHQNMLLSKENEINALELNRTRYLMFSLSALIVIVSLGAWLLIRQNRLKASAKALQLEQKLLRSQMNPHFIFNSLSAIQSFMIKNNTEQSVAYLSSFARLMRLILENSREEFTTLDNEIKMLEYYLQLQKLRVGEKLQYSIQIESGLDTENIVIPPMLSQPFIENAIEHGIIPASNPGLVEIHFKRQENVLVMEIIDNGTGLQPANKDKKHKSLATVITRERLAIINSKSKTKASFVIENLAELLPSGQGTRVQFQLPYRLAF